MEKSSSFRRASRGGVSGKRSRAFGNKTGHVFNLKKKKMTDPADAIRMSRKEMVEAVLSSRPRGEEKFESLLNEQKSVDSAHHDALLANKNEWEVTASTQQQQQQQQQQQH